MNPNPFFGVCLHWLGGLASGSFYVPYHRVKKWSWETYWLVGGFFAWIICPWALASFMTHDLGGVLRQQPAGTLWWTYFFGLLWGFGALTFGLAIRYLGMSLGMGVALGYCAALGTVLPPVFKTLMPKLPVSTGIVEIAKTTSGQVTLGGVGICLLGIGIAALAGLAKERRMPEEQKKKAIAEFSFRKGMVVATFSGILSACFAFALQAGKPINEASLAAGTSPIWTGLPSLTILLLGGFTTNFVWCVFLNFKRRSGHEYFTGRGAAVASADPLDSGLPLLSNYFFSALAGITWYFQFFFYTMGASQMGKYDFAFWTLHMASIIIFSTTWGWILREWRGAGKKAHCLIAAGIATLIISTLVIGWGSYLQGH
ncbi:MAG TPA: L-rhamnose/proton symporter RhaT [Verrucomicrobiae bacterium]|nr:L-rhamnose/proton symporter RhaT [Verrucomicrobiae bacterium]